jgi:hypothetical protein
MFKKSISVLLLFLLLLILVLPASALLVEPDNSTVATNFSVSELGLAGPQTIQVYSDGSLMGTYNTTSDAIPIPTHDFLIVVKPELKNEDPLVIFAGLLTWITDNLVIVILGLGAVVLITRRW